MKSMQRGKSTICIAVIALIVLAGGYWFFTQQDSNSAPDTTQPAEGVAPAEPTISGELLDVTKGEDVRGINTGGTASGTASAGFANGQYRLEAVFENLPEPQGTDFYEGWVVRRGGEFSVISTGPLTQEDGTTYSNVFTSAEDLLDHDFYVLTLEPDDGDPAPADHIVEGEMK